MLILLQKIAKMADNRLPNMAGQPGMHHQTAFTGMPNMRMGTGPMGQPMYPGAGGQQQFAAGMQFYPAQGMNPSTMGLMPGMAPPMYSMQSMRAPGGPPPPYTQQLAASYHNKARGHPGSKKIPAEPPKPKTDKERYFEEQQKRLRQFHRPGAPVADANTLIENLFGKTEKGHGHGHGQSQVYGGGGPHQSGGHGEPASHVAPSGQNLDDDDGFGDFLGGPTAAVTASATAVSAANTISNSNQRPTTVSSPAPEIAEPELKSEQNVTISDHKPAAEKKDLMSLMMECSDLNAPQKARGFHKPSLMEVQKSGITHHGAKNSSMHHESDHARRWDNTQDLEGLFIVERKSKGASQPGSVPPSSPSSSSSTIITSPHHDNTSYHHPPADAEPSAAFGAQGTFKNPAGSGEMVSGLPDWCYDSGHNLPVVYHHVLEAVSDGETIVTERLYPILVMSGLPRELLGRLWALANTQMPGQLSRSELWILLAFVALVQNNYEVTSAAILKRCPQAPVPFLGQPSAHTANTADSALAQPSTPVSAGHDSHDTTALSFPAYGHTTVGGLSTASSAQVAILPTITTTTTTSNNADDDFADFQTAAPSHALKASLPPAPVPVTMTTTSVTKTEDSYGEFIGGSSSLTPEPSLSSVPKEAADKLEKMYSNGGMTSMTADEQYNSNVRNFFCSSDSSTAEASPCQKMTRHTTPNSMDDEDFTDGHDSMSQVSTSEQSENEDIRAFENYVEEFNRKRDAQVSADHSAHGAGLKSPTDRRAGPHKSSSSTGKAVSGKSSGSSAMTTIRTPPAVNFPIPRPPGPGSHSTIPAVPGAASRTLSISHGVRDKVEEGDDFADFKSASPGVGGSECADSQASVRKVESSGDMVLMGEEDKYSALRVLTSDRPSLFEAKSEAGPDAAGSHQPPQEEEADDWADFSSAAVVDSVSVSAQPGQAELSVSEVRSNHQSCGGSFSMMGTTDNVVPGDDWADFSTAVPSTTPAAGLGTDLGFGTTSSSDTSLFSKAAFSAQDKSWSGYSDVHEVPMAESIFSNTVQLSGVEMTSTGDNAGQVEKDTADDWADFASAGPASSHSHVATSNSFSVVGRGDVGTGLFSASHMASGSSEEVFTGPEQSAVLTVKKKNLGASEIMNVFRVRDDPATLSSYELPKQTKEDHQEASFRRHGSRGGSKEHQTSPDLDDDFGMGPPPLDSVGDDDDEHEFSRGYDLDDIVNPPVPTTIYSPFGFSHHSPGYARSAFTAVTKRPTGKDVQPASTESRSHSMSPDSGETDSLSNRVSSIREDSQSVSSLDLPASKISSMEAQRDSDNGGTDSQSVSSMEFGSGEGGRLPTEGGGVTESKSLDSLDLKTGGGGGGGGGISEEDEGDEGSNRWSRQGSQPPRGMMGPAPILADRYNLDGQVEGSERYTFEWERCLASSCRLINGANNIFNTISSSAVCNEVLKSPQGSDYVCGLIEVYRVVCRIMTALPTTAVNSASIEQSLKQIDLAWNNLTAFLVGASLLPDEMTFTFSQAVLKSDSPAAQAKACGVCLLDVDCHQRGAGGSEELAKLSYGGRQYHAACANFWVNCVDSMLPALKLPELL